VLISAAQADALRMDVLAEPMPAIRWPSADGQRVLDLAALRGHFTLLHFWATWCTPCRTELPQLLAMHDLPGAPAIEVVLVSIDDSAGQASLSRYAETLHIKAPIFLANAGTGDADFWAWGVPATYLITPTGQIRGRFLGPRDWTASNSVQEIRLLLDGDHP
jgi:thiol-disulfide isomerase/thioredoxin